MNTSKAQTKGFYTLVEEILEQTGLTWTSPTAGHYRLSDFSKQKITWYPKRHTISIAEKGEQQRQKALVILPASTLGAQLRADLKQILAEFKEN